MKEGRALRLFLTLPCAMASTAPCAATAASKPLDPAARLQALESELAAARVSRKALVAKITSLKQEVVPARRRIVLTSRLDDLADLRHAHAVDVAQEVLDRGSDKVGSILRFARRVLRAVAGGHRAAAEDDDLWSTDEGGDDGSSSDEKGE